MYIKATLKGCFKIIQKYFYCFEWPEIEQTLAGFKPTASNQEAVRKPVAVMSLSLQRGLRLPFSFCNQFN
jgi:hypothetical protein